MHRFAPQSLSDYTAAYKHMSSPFLSHFLLFVCCTIQCLRCCLFAYTFCVVQQATTNSGRWTAIMRKLNTIIEKKSRVFFPPLLGVGSGVVCRGGGKFLHGGRRASSPSCCYIITDDDNGVV
jgi:hypothetical protein